ncbi:MAG TPA: hypothetical protein VHL57_12165, partial [Flavobacteriales bacterium]|nr:hypothetical protein [Flavobacteriales bacterium]
FDLGNDTTICSNAELVLTASLPGGSTTWSTGATGPTLTVSTAGDYTATIHVGACAVSDDIAVSVVPSPTIDLGADRTLCEGTELLLSAQPFAGASFLWDDGSTNIDRTVDGAGTYWARASANGCVASDTVVVTNVPVPSVALGADTALCPGDVRQVNVATPNATYLWNDGSTAAVRYLGPGSWNVAVTVSGCTTTDAIVITEKPAPVVELPADTVLCPGLSWTIDLSAPGTTYLWQDGSTSGSYNVSAAGNYAVTADLDGCTTQGSVNVTYLDPTALDLGPDTALCPGTTLMLASPFLGAGITWQDGSHDPTFTVHHEGIYRLLVDANGCTAEDSVHVTQVDLVVPDLGLDQRLCAGQLLTLSVSPGDASVLWSTGSDAHSITVDSAGTYAVTLFLEGCFASDEVAVVFDPMTTHIDLGDDLEMCPGHTVDLDASALAGSYRWNTGATDPVITVTMPGIYTVLVEGTCLHATDTVVIAAGECLPFVFVPNAFTPDGDGHNDLFAP